MKKTEFIEIVENEEKEEKDKQKQIKNKKGSKNQQRPIKKSILDKNTMKNIKYRLPKGSHGIFPMGKN